ncbi:hypothetical protein GLOIN_2v1498826 [Rhizophagus clarus]|uniref:Uncharacterized protein n=1 Tax=Rhizophagus clarus TaxID=94130 RepID=A0A8H3QVC7_9GLOM|nr:hypothetical protein GLOIN_2v1498826 [Rhizophagus clarus]
MSEQSTVLLEEHSTNILRTIHSNRTLVFPPPISDSHRLYERLNSRLPRNRLVTGRGLLRYFVSKYAESISVSSYHVITLVTDQLWRNATHQEKYGYIFLALMVNEQIKRNMRMDTDTTTVDLTNTNTTTVDQTNTNTNTTTVDLIVTDTTDTTTVDLMVTDTVDTTTVDPMDIDTTLEVDTADSPIKYFADIGYTNLCEVILWWEDEKELYEEDNGEDIMMAFFYEKLGEANDFMDIVDDPHFSQQAKNALLEISDDFIDIFDNYTPWEWFSWYIHMSYMFTTSTPAPCPFNSVKTKLPENLQHFHYQGTISKNIKPKEVEQFREFINLVMGIKPQIQDDSKVWYHGTSSVAASSIARRIDLTVCNHFNHAFGFHRSFYIGDNLKYCLTRALKKARETRNVNCALVVFCINDGELCLIREHLKLICREDSQGHVNTNNIWEDIVPDSKNSNENSNLDEDPIRPNVQWVEGPNLKRSNANWVPKKDDIIRSFRTDE